MSTYEHDQNISGTSPGSESQNDFDAFLRQNSGPIPEAPPHHEQNMMSRIPLEAPSFQKARTKLSRHPWTVGMFAMAAALSLYVWTCSSQEHSNSLGSGRDLAAVEILADSVDELDQMVSYVPQSYW